MFICHYTRHMMRASTDILHLTPPLVLLKHTVYVTLVKSRYKNQVARLTSIVLSHLLQTFYVLIWWKSVTFPKRRTRQTADLKKWMWDWTVLVVWWPAPPQLQFLAVVGDWQQKSNDWTITNGFCNVLMEHVGGKQINKKCTHCSTHHTAYNCC